ILIARPTAAQPARQATFCADQPSAAARRPARSLPPATCPQPSAPQPPARNPPGRPAGVTVNFIRSDHTPVCLREHHGTVTYSGTGRATRDMIEDRLDQIRLRFEVLRRTLPQGSR